MVLWFIVGLIVLSMCILCILSIARAVVISHENEQKLYFRRMENTQNIEDSVKKEVKKATRTRKNQGLLISAYKRKLIRKHKRKSFTKSL